MFKHKIIIAMISIVSATPTFAVSLMDIMKTNYLETGKTPHTQLNEFYDQGQKPELGLKDRPWYAGQCYLEFKRISDPLENNGTVLLLRQIDLYGPGPSFPVIGRGILSTRFLYEPNGYYEPMDNDKMSRLETYNNAKTNLWTFAQDEALVVLSVRWPNSIYYSIRSFGDYFIAKVFRWGPNDAPDLCYFNRLNSPKSNSQAIRK